MPIKIVSPELSKLKVLLIVPPNFSLKLLQEEIDNLRKASSDFTKSVDWRISSPLGILYLAGTLRKSGFNCQIYDLHREFYLCREQGFFVQKSLENFFEQYLDDILLKDSFDIIGISCLFNANSTTVQEIGNRCRQKAPYAKIILGGHYPTNQYREVLENKICDYVILGEAEEELEWLMRNLFEPGLEEKISQNPHIVDINCINNAEKTPACIQDLDNLAFPAWDLLPYNKDYIEKSLHADRVGSSNTSMNTIKSAGIITTRGCPMQCTFCAAHGVHGRKVRAHSIDYVIKHIDWLVEKFEVSHLLIEDDMFNYSQKRTIDFCQRLHAKYPNRFTIEFPNGFAVWTLNNDVVKHLKRIGLKTITIAIESGNVYVQKYILKKNLNLDLIREKVQLLRDDDIGVRGFFILGFVGETLDMMHDTIQFALDLNLDWAEIKVFTPLVGSEMYETAKANGYLVGDTSEHIYGRCSIKTPDFTPEQVENLRYDANIRINFLNNRNLKERKFENAEKTFSKILEVYPNHLFAMWGLWKAFEGQKKTDQANTILENIKKLIKNDVRNQALIEKYKIFPS